MGTFIAVLPDGREYFQEVSGIDKYYCCADNAVRHFGVTRKSYEVNSMKIKIYRQKIENGQLCRIFIDSLLAFVPLYEMNDKELESKIGLILADVPSNFWSMIEEIVDLSELERHPFSKEDKLEHYKKWAEKFKSALYDYKVDIAREIAGDD